MKCILPGCMAEMCPVGTVEGGVVQKTAGNAGIACRLPALDHGACRQKPLDGHIFPEGGTGGLLEDPADLRSAAVEGISQKLQGERLKEMLVHIGD